MKKSTPRMILMFAAIIFITISFSGVSNATTIILSATEDSIILDEDNRNNLFPGILASELDTSGGGTVWLSVLKFDLSSLTGMTVTNATLELTSIFNHSAGSFSHNVFSSSDDSWTEGTVTGINHPLDSTLTLLASTAINGVSQAYSWDVLAGVSGMDGLSGANGFLTLLVRPELSQAGSGGFGPHFNDRTSLTGFPRLLIDATPVPVPGAIWLVSSGLTGLFGMKKSLQHEPR